MTRRLVVSDVHIGSKYYKPKNLIDLLEHEKYDELVLAGDIIDFIKIPTFTKNCLELIKQIMKVKNVVYITGNHDIALENWEQEQLGGIKFTRQYDFFAGNRKIRIVHGDQFQHGIVKRAGIMKILSVLQDIIERLFNFDITNFLHKHILKRLELKNIENILSENKDIDVLIMGHTHVPEALVWIQPDHQIKTYVNSGDWVSNCTYVTIESNGEVRLRKYVSKTTQQY
jgi:UDP-2,3-diacylglucosamine pyrophosphatase LpxH